MRHIRSPQGFTLFEILIAITILGIALPMLFQLFSGTLRSVKQSKDYTQAMALAKQKLEELTMMKVAPLEPESGEESSGLFWERVVVPIDEEALITPSAPLYEATVSVRWDADPSAPSTSLHTLIVFAPAPPVEIDAELPALEESPDETTP